MPFSQIIPQMISLSHRVQKTVLYISVSFAVSYGTPLQYSCLENPMDREAW